MPVALYCSQVASFGRYEDFHDAGTGARHGCKAFFDYNDLGGAIRLVADGRRVSYSSSAFARQVYFSNCTGVMNCDGTRLEWLRRGSRLKMNPCSLGEISARQSIQSKVLNTEAARTSR